MPTILLIDDEPAIQHAFRKAFHPPEYDTTTVPTAAEGLQRLSTKRPDVVVLDVHLPDADGLQAFDRVKEIDVRVPIVLITGHGTTDLAIEAMKKGRVRLLAEAAAPRSTQGDHRPGLYVEPVDDYARGRGRRRGRSRPCRCPGRPL